MKQTIAQVFLFLISTVSAFTTKDPTGDDDNDTNETSTWMSVWRREFLPSREMSSLITAVSSPVILVFGVFGNAMIILIMHGLSGSLLNVFFQVLAWSDLLLLSTGLLPNIMSEMFGTSPIENLGSWPCRIFKVVIYTTGVVSPWMLVALTMQRAASVLWPHRINAVWTQTKSRVVAAVLVSSSVLIHCHFVYGWGYDKEKCSDYLVKCCPLVVSESYAWFYHIIWPWVDLVEFSLLPFVLLVISNSVLLWKLISSVRTVHRLPMQQNSQESRQRKVSSLTVTLLTVIGSFFLLTTPASVYFISRPIVLTAAVFRQNPALGGRYIIFYACSQSMWYANSAVNFYLYCLTGTKFRAEFVNIMRKFFCLFFWTRKAGSKRRSVKSSATASSPDTDPREGKKAMRTKTDNEEF